MREPQEKGEKKGNAEDRLGAEVAGEVALWSKAHKGLFLNELQQGTTVGPSRDWERAKQARPA